MIAATQIRIDDRKSFQKLKTALHRRLVDAIDFDKAAALDEWEMRKQLRSLAAHICSDDSSQLPAPVRDAIVGEIMDEIYGYGPLQPLLSDPNVSDVCVNGADSVWVERNGVMEEADARFADDAHVLRLIRRLLARSDRRIDDRAPLIEATLPDGSRLNVVLPPLARRGPTLAIRRLKSSLLDLEDMVGTESLAAEMAELLVAAVRGRLNILVAGGTGAGKTTLLNNLARCIPSSERIVTIERTAELQLPQSDVASLQTQPADSDGRGAVTLRDLLRQSLSLRPDRIVLGEARGAEVIDLLQAINGGHDGSMTTVPASDVRNALDRLEMMAALADAELPSFTIRQHIAAAMQLVVHTARLASGERKVLRISEICGYRDGQYQIEDIFVCRVAGFDENGPRPPPFYATGYEPAALGRLASLGYHLPEDLFAPRELSAGVQYLST